MRRLAAMATAGMACLWGAAGSAQTADWSEGWSGQATIYGWLPAIDGAQEGPDGQPVVNLDNADVFDALDMAFMGAAEIRKGKFGLLLDAVYADLSVDGTWLQQRVDTSVETKLGFYTLAAAYRVYEEERTYFDVYGGARYFDAELTFDISTDRGNRSLQADLSWTDPIVGIRGSVPLSERWSVSGFADVGGFDSGSDMSWEVYGGANYAFAEHWAGTIGYRYVSIEKSVTSRATLDIDIQGPLVGITYKF